MKIKITTPMEIVNVNFQKKILDIAYRNTLLKLQI